MTKDTSWELSEDWYHTIVGEKGHFYHETIILDGVLQILNPKKPFKILDIGCGQGVLQRRLPPFVSYTGIDSSKSLLAKAKNLGSGNFILADACQPFPLEDNHFDAACFILSLQNMEHPELAIANAAKLLKKGGKLVLVLNHPCFRIPRQSHWGFDESAKLQYRRMNLYMSPQKIPIQTNPGQKSASSTTFSFHFPISSIVKWLATSGLSVTAMDEWCSGKKSTGPKAKMEDRARKEFPLFLTITAIKN